MNLRCPLLIFCIVMSTEQMHGMAAVVELFDKLSVIPQKPKRELKTFLPIDSYTDYTRSIGLWYNEIQTKIWDPKDYSFYMFVDSSYEDVCILLKKLTLGTKTHILEYDFRKPEETTRWERNQQVFQLFKDAERLYEETGEPVIVHFHHIESAVVRGHPDEFRLHLSYDPFQSGGRPIYLVSSTETSGDQIRGDFLNRHNSYVIEEKNIYGWSQLRLFNEDNAKIRIQNYAIHAANAAIIGGVAGILVAMALKVVKHGKIQKKPQATESALEEKNE